MRFYKTMLWKAYFDKGYGLTSYPKCIAAVGAIKISSVKTIIIIGFLYTLLCFFVGWLWYKYRIVDAEIEVGNQFNPFVKEVRDQIDLSGADKKLFGTPKNI